MPDRQRQQKRPWQSLKRLPGGVWALGMVSLLMDSSSELVHSLLPMFMATVLGASMTEIGVIEGLAEATAAFSKLFSGVLSDWLGKRKFIVVAGYGLAALSKPLFPLASSLGWVFTARFIDRIGKGIRGAPRDALIADITPTTLRGAAYGLRQALDSVGAFIGPLLALLFMALLADNITAVLWIAVLPAVLAVLLLIVAVREPEQVKANHTKAALTLAGAGALPPRFWLIILFGAVFTLARFSDAFLLLRAEDVGMGIGMVPLVMIIMNIVYAAVSYPAGVAADHHNPRTLLLAGLVLLVLADAVLALADAPWVVLVGSVLWGMHMGLTQGLLSKLVADVAPAPLRATAFGIFNLVTGLALLLASVVAGILWDAIGADATFITGGGFAAVAAIALLLYRRPGRSRPNSGM